MRIGIIGLGLAGRVHLDGWRATPDSEIVAIVDPSSDARTWARDAGLKATILRPWYVLGPDHRWPVVLCPFYRLAEQFPGTRESARRLGLVTIHQMIGALINAAENSAEGVRVVEVPEIRRAALSTFGIPTRSSVLIAGMFIELPIAIFSGSTPWYLRS